MGRRRSWVLSDIKNLTPEQRDVFFQHARRLYRLRDYVMLVLAFNGAMRGNEVFHLRVSSFNFASHSVSIIPSKKAGKRTLSRGGVVTTVHLPLPDAVSCPLVPEVVKLVRKYVEDTGLSNFSWLFPGRVKKCDVVEYGCSGGHLSVRTLERIFDKVLMSAGLKVHKRGVHSLRHARLTEVYETEKDIRSVMEVGRLDDQETALAYIMNSRLKEIIGRVGGRL